MAREKREVIVRGMTEEWFLDHFKDMKVYFSGGRAVPRYDTDFIGFYIEAPASAITHLGVVEAVERQSDSATFVLKAILKLDKPVEVAHAVRKQEYWSLRELGITKIAVVLNQFAKVGGEN
jgi:hypothetical protein